MPAITPVGMGERLACGGAPALSTIRRHPRRTPEKLFCLIGLLLIFSLAAIFSGRLASPQNNGRPEQQVQMQNLRRQMMGFVAGSGSPWEKAIDSRHFHQTGRHVKSLRMRGGVGEPCGTVRKLGGTTLFVDTTVQDTRGAGALAVSSSNHDGTSGNVSFITASSSSSPSIKTVTALLSLVYSITIWDNSSAAIEAWCTLHGGNASITSERSDVEAAGGPGYGSPLPESNLTTFNAALFRSFLSVTTTESLMAGLVSAGNNGTILGVLSIQTWSKTNAHQSREWIAGVVVAALVLLGTFGLIAVRLLFRQGYVSTTGPHLQNTYSYRDLEMARTNYEVMVGHNNLA